MAYMSQENKKELAPGIKAVLKKFGFKGTLSVRHHSSLVVTVAEGPVSLPNNHHGNSYAQVNEYYIEDHWDGIWKDFLLELKAAMMIGNHNNSDLMSDYFDVGWYININIGRWDKAYKITKK
jgi:hypothetical protein